MSQLDTTLGASRWTKVRDECLDYIEVKAVSPNTFTFYWSQREVDVAKVLGQHYYLYLLPVDRRTVGSTFPG